MGFKLFENIEKEYGKEKIFEARKMERDASFILKYLNQEMCKEMNLFQYGKKFNTYFIEEISDDEGFRTIRNNIVASVGLGGIPCIKVEDIARRDHVILLSHEYDGRELELNYAVETMKYISTIWGGKVLLKTVIENEEKVITCDEDKIVTINNI
jgi:stage V sporulation protein R